MINNFISAGKITDEKKKQLFNNVLILIDDLYEQVDLDNLNYYFDCTSFIKNQIFKKSGKKGVLEYFNKKNDDFGIFFRAFKLFRYCDENSIDLRNYDAKQ